MYDFHKNSIKDMDKTNEFLRLKLEESDPVSRLTFPPVRFGTECSFYEHFALRGIRVDRVDEGLVSCSFRVPARLADRSGKLANGAIANLVDEVGGAVAQIEGQPMNVSVDMSICYLGTAKVGDDLYITSKILGRKGGYSGTIVHIRNKATGELVAEGRHSLFGRHASKM